ncbi:hypothetical protein [Marinobacter algicola]|uniref:hypothetical protein n=1 Tax=Marinobacter algicola TaxID=236100 RepID=UPI003BABB6D2
MEALKGNKGSAGVDALDIAQSAEHLRWTWRISGNNCWKVARPTGGTVPHR